ncbi:uncharacterized protein BYT42DRAFT_617641 [Radiomyces spectabilis]|uniref:uncharacterized protein n=1 Tax=Radiomyces spectabilis TaxID=64574 RepID=UPI00221F9144|nr:uncharacterized protein BYT42DRAFT_617641 [Radiomyces spectabilis]KAI8369641.1 hypothetical protein BYT42DRAFT_617641 [Radiomyces spectabilis]
MTSEKNDPFSILIDDETDEFLPKVETILREIFDRFDKDKDGVWNNKELQDFAEATNGRSEIVDSFDVDDKDQLTYKGFYQMYHIQTLSDPEETLNDFQKHGYDSNLELVTSRTRDENPKSPVAAEEDNQA